MFPKTRGNNFCPPAEKLFFKSMRNFFPKQISTDVKRTFDNSVRSFSTQFLEERFFSTSFSPVHPECNFDNTDCQIRGHSSRKKIGVSQKFFLQYFLDNSTAPLTTPTGDFLRDIQSNLLLLAFAPKKTAHVICVSDNNGRCCYTQSSKETHFFQEILPSQNPENVFVITTHFWPTISGENQEKFIESLITLRS